MGERSLHNEIKNWYAKPGDQVEVPVDNYVIDIVRDDLLLEIQTKNFSAIKSKLNHLIKKHKIRLIYPISQIKWIVRNNSDYETIKSRRRSPKKGRLEDVFTELVYIPRLISDPHFELEVLFIHSEDIFTNDGKGSWRRKRWSIQDRRLLKVVSSQIIRTTKDLRSIIPEELNEGFTTRQLAKQKRMPIALTRKMIYCLKKMGIIEKTGNRGRSPIYSTNF